MNNFVSLEWIAGGNCPAIRGNPFSSSTSFERDNINGLRMKEIILTQGKVALVDDDDYEYLNQWKWQAVKAPHTFYAARGMKRNGRWSSEKMHRLMFDIPYDSRHSRIGLRLPAKKCRAFFVVINFSAADCPELQRRRT